MRKTRIRALKAATLRATGREPRGMQVVGEGVEGIVYVTSEKRRLKKWYMREHAAGRVKE